MLSQLGLIVGPLGAILGPSWALFVPSWGHLGPSWGFLGASLGSSWLILAHLVPYLGYLQLSSTHLSPTQLILTQLKANLKPSWPHVGPTRKPWTLKKYCFFPQFFQCFSYCALLASTSNLMPHVEPSWPHLGPSWGYLGAILGPLGAILGPSWAILGPLWAHLGATLGSSGPILPHLVAHLGNRKPIYAYLNSS